jgi:tRNA-splicing ligase RtcB (3'-phosphate/5'-hydroxy nucleic acid ligase)
MAIKRTIDKGRVPVKIWTDEVEHGALQQLINVSTLPIVHSHIAVMPDVHAGIGATVGSVIPTKRAVIPAAVGVDIGCGMNAVRLSLTGNDLPDSLGHVRSAIERAIPVGFDQHDHNTLHDTALVHVGKKLNQRLNAIVKRHPDLTKMQKNFARTWLAQIGTLGGGNHFIELCLDEENRVWIMLHSGSRGIGNVMGRYFIQQARKEAERNHLHLPDKDLAWFADGTDLFDDYVEAVDWAQDYALLNRRQMMELIVDALRPLLPPFTFDGEAINCHHNYVAQEKHFGETLFITRKGAISAKNGELGIIPGSMGAKSYIVRGKGNEQSFHSCSHGAGRLMSRTEAKKRFKRKDLKEQTAGIECRKDGGVIDEIPGAYKNIDEVVANQTDLIEVVHMLKQVICVKG